MAHTKEQRVSFLKLLSEQKYTDEVGIDTLSTRCTIMKNILQASTTSCFSGKEINKIVKETLVKTSCMATQDPTTRKAIRTIRGNISELEFTHVIQKTGQVSLEKPVEDLEKQHESNTKKVLNANETKLKTMPCYRKNMLLSTLLFKFPTILTAINIQEIIKQIELYKSAGTKPEYHFSAEHIWDEFNKAYISYFKQTNTQAENINYAIRMLRILSEFLKKHKNYKEKYEQNSEFSDKNKNFFINSAIGFLKEALPEIYLTETLSEKIATFLINIQKHCEIKQHIESMIIMSQIYNDKMRFTDNIPELLRIPQHLVQNNRAAIQVLLNKCDSTNDKINFLCELEVCTHHLQSKYPGIRKNNLALSFIKDELNRSIQQNESQAVIGQKTEQDERQQKIMREEKKREITLTALNNAEAVEKRVKELLVEYKKLQQLII